MMWQMPLTVNRTPHFPCSMTYHCYPVDLQRKKNINNPGIFSEIHILHKKLKNFIFSFFNFNSSFFYIPLGRSFPAIQMFLIFYNISARKKVVL